MSRNDAGLIQSSANYGIQFGWWLARQMLSVLNFHYDRLKHEVYFNFSIYLNHKQMQLHHYNCCDNQDHKKKYHAQEHKKYPEKPFSTREENPTILCYILKRKTSHTIDLAHKRVLSKTKMASAQERCTLQP
jgi:hypothetical protein